MWENGGNPQKRPQPSWNFFEPDRGFFFLIPCLSRRAIIAMLSNVPLRHTANVHLRFVINYSDAVKRAIKAHLTGRKPQCLTFPMIGRANYSDA